MEYDVMIIGGGPGGYTAANKAAALGLKTILFEKDKIGGTCLNRGCIPMKALIEAAHTYKHALHGDVYGIRAEKLSFDYEAINKRRDEVVEKLRNGVEKSLKANKVEVIKGTAQISDPHHVSCEGKIYEGKNIVIATGSTSAEIPIEGIENAITSDEILEKDFRLPASLIIIGGGVIGVEVANAFNDLGVQIEIIEMAPRLIPTMEKELSQRLKMFFAKNGIKVDLEAAVTRIGSEEGMKYVIYKDKNGNEVRTQAQEVLIAVGRKAMIDGLFKEGFTLPADRGIIADEKGKTAYDNIYVIGDARSGNIQLAHLAAAQGENVIDTIINKESRIDETIVPSGIYTDPQIASVGESEDSLKEKGIAYQAKKVLSGANGKCLIENSESGFVKVLLVDEVIVGASIVAPNATELIGELAVAVGKKMRLSQLGQVIHPHPTIAEMIWDVSR